MHRSGFSLVELSIVMVILGLLVGGVLGGQTLIRAAELRNIITERDKISVSVNAFRLKYNALPADMTNATDYWGAAHSNNTTCQTTARSGTQTCNGDGNGYISGFYSYEDTMLWEHLSLAGLVEGKYVGYSSALTGSQMAIIDVTNPRSKLNGVGYSIAATFAPTEPWLGYDLSFNDPWGTSKKNYLFMVKLDQGANGGYWEGNGGGDQYKILTPAEAFNVDSKIDDGKPGLGKVKAFWRHSSSTCTTGFTSLQGSTAVYNLSYDSPACSFISDIGI